MCMLYKSVRGAGGWMEGIPVSCANLACHLRGPGRQILWRGPEHLLGPREKTPGGGAGTCIIHTQCLQRQRERWRGESRQAGPILPDVLARKSTNFFLRARSSHLSFVSREAGKERGEGERRRWHPQLGRASVRVGGSGPPGSKP